ncbi:AbrB/MazE/SpoVT family DNA-binding domain-containing protein [Candidatus Woesearchaeota archaeon]|nr:MAG: AbrB/MazE/SpoVT family DNA-binding domain-containing protein [Candidatus Woesearchaeota archaeon]
MKKASTSDICFANKVVKQGNSYCVRIPKGVLEYLNIEGGDIVKVIIGRDDTEVKK